MEKEIKFIDQESTDLERVLSKSDLSSFASDDSLSPPPPTIPIRNPSLLERRNVQFLNVKISDPRTIEYDVIKSVILKNKLKKKCFQICIVVI